MIRYIASKQGSFRFILRYVCAPADLALRHGFWLHKYCARGYWYLFEQWIIYVKFSCKKLQIKSGQEILDLLSHVCFLWKHSNGSILTSPCAILILMSFFRVLIISFVVLVLVDSIILDMFVWSIHLLAPELKDEICNSSFLFFLYFLIWYWFWTSSIISAGFSLRRPRV